MKTKAYAIFQQQNNKPLICQQPLLPLSEKEVTVSLCLVLRLLLWGEHFFLLLLLWFLRDQNFFLARLRHLSLRSFSRFGRREKQIR